MGRYGCDPPYVLLDTMLDAFIEYHGKQDVILITGDLCGHHTSLSADLYPEGGSTDVAILTHSKLVDLLGKKFPDTPIIPVFGNNDMKYHDNPEPLDEDQEFYEYIYDLWFDKLPGNKRSE